MILLKKIKMQATKLTELTQSQMHGLSTKNLDCKEDLANCDYLAIQAATCSSRKFTGYGSEMKKQFMVLHPFQKLTR